MKACSIWFREKAFGKGASGPLLRHEFSHGAILCAVNVCKVKCLNTTQMPGYFVNASTFSTTNSIGRENIQHLAKERQEEPVAMKELGIL